jgi:multiple sugar transport system permease protein
MNAKRSASIKVDIKKTILTAIILFVGYIFVFPLISTVLMSFKGGFELMKYPERFLPLAPTLENYATVLTNKYNYPLLYLNSIKITSINVAGCVITSVLSGYAFGRLKFPGRDGIFMLYLATLMIPPQVTLIPRFMQFTWMGVTNSHLSLILPGIFSIIGVFLMRQYYRQIPFELSESAYIDGASEYTTFLRVILPMTKPAVMAIVITTFTWQWNDYENPLIFLRNASLYTLPLGFSVFSDENGTKYELVSAASVLACLPMIIVFIIAQKQFIAGLAAGSLKE